MKNKHPHFKALFSGLAGKCKTREPPPLPTDLCNMQECILETTQKKSPCLKMHVLNCGQATVAIEDQLKAAESNSYSVKHIQHDF